MITATYFESLIKEYGINFVRKKYKEDKEFRKEIKELYKELTECIEMDKRGAIETHSIICSKEEYKEKIKLLGIKDFTIEERGNKIIIKYKTVNQPFLMLYRYYSKILTQLIKVMKK